MSLLSNLTARQGSVLISYKRVSKADGSRLLNLQRDALIDAGVAADRISSTWWQWWTTFAAGTWG